MGCDISILSRHNLNITSVATLADDLANRLGFSIDYGYYAVKEYNALLKNNLNEDWISLGYIDKQPAVQKYRLIDEKYQIKELVAMYGNAIFQKQEYWHWCDEMPTQDKIDAEINDKAISDYLLEGYYEDTGSGYLTIYNHVLTNDLHYFSRWGSFCRGLQEFESYSDNYFLDFRKAVMHSTLLLGGDKAYFVNDQCKHLKGVGQGEEMYYNWEALEQYINTIETLEVISLSKAVLDMGYHFQLKLKEIDNLAFVDDFDDLKQ